MKRLAYIEAISQALEEEMRRDESVFIVGESIQEGAFGETRGLVDIFGPERIMDTPISETAIAGIALGAAEKGYRPIANFMFSDFMFCAMDEIVDKAARFRELTGGQSSLPLVFMAAVGGYIGAGVTHSQVPVAPFMHIPGIKIALPSTPYDAMGLMKSAIRDDNPVIFFYHKALFPTGEGSYSDSLKFTDKDIENMPEIRNIGSMGDIPDEEYLVPLGKGDIKRKGNDITIIAFGLMVHFALHVADKMKDEVDIEVVDPRTYEPLDIEMILSSVNKTGRAIVVDEDTSRCGPAGEIAMLIYENAQHVLKAPVVRVATKNYPIPRGVSEKLILPYPHEIEAAVRKVMNSK